MSQVAATSQLQADISQRPCTNQQYIYGIIPTRNHLIFDIAGMDDDDDEVYTVPLGDLAAVTGHTARADYRGMTRPVAVRYLVIHQRVVEAVLADYPILPVKFGTVLADEASLFRLLVQGKPLFQAALAKIARQVQMEVVVLWNPQEVLAQVAQEEPIARRKAELASRPPQETSAERVALGQMVFASLECRRNAIRDRVLPSLRQIASDVVMNPLMDENMVLNVALLIDKAENETLSRELESLDQEFGGRLYFRCVGPLPPYSFATVEVQAPAFEAVDGARCRLGLGEAATAGEIKKAYHRLAEQMHPDHNPQDTLKGCSQDAQAKARMIELTQAYHLLMSFSTSQALYQADACSFSREAVERTLLIDIRRQESSV
jgi:hypothetical protein